MKGTVKWFNEEKDLDLSLQKTEATYSFTSQQLKLTDSNVLKKDKSNI